MPHPHPTTTQLAEFSAWLDACTTFQAYELVRGNDDDIIIITIPPGCSEPRALEVN